MRLSAARGRGKEKDPSKRAMAIMEWTDGNLHHPDLAVLLRSMALEPGDQKWALFRDALRADRIDTASCALLR